ncbi:hypothetical protein STCU_11701 [Strigomonas culicis]|uniref:Uncharacterized protein n=1 Tax=Strigomonas culicis TaxID=28005 RepID=S9UZ90_9TRYP|nr:hypothetical protein STCU_11701 [Strigomonas culicis]|eukprot:EPY15880.1 hypothetical protein STCU_11701 [Strigomonas culicis]
MSNQPITDGLNVEDSAGQIDRLRRDNRLLRLQVLKMQRERRRRQEAAAGAAAAVDRTAAAAAGSCSADPTDALQLRIQTLQRQNEREKQRRGAVERELRGGD